MTPWPLRELARRIASDAQPTQLSDVEVTTLSIDSRSCAPGALFFALPGTVSDGHAYVGAALHSGAVGAVVARSWYVDGTQKDLVTRYREALIPVGDVLRALQEVARVHLRERASAPVVGVTGSAGKTTVKEFVAATLSPLGNVYRSPGNLNSDIGLPLAVSEISPATRVAVLEMGMNRRGEIDELVSIAPPEHAVITGIGTAHIGKIGSAEGIAGEKKRICSRFTGRQTLYVPSEDRFAPFLSADVNGRVVFFGPTATNGFSPDGDAGIEGQWVRLSGRRFLLRHHGRHNLANAAAAVAVARGFGVSDGHIADALESVGPADGRGRVLGKSPVVIDDSYNASPEAVRAAVRSARSIEPKRRHILVLADMLELGGDAAALHEEVLREVVDGHDDSEQLILFGPHMSAAARRLGLEVPAVEDAAGGFHQLSEVVCNHLLPADVVLLKGSRGMGLERLLPGIVNREGESGVS
jgi:UDP-N-acetylmuramoyl-tripeptide--D-alanyl-D-alanine ligase